MAAFGFVLQVGASLAAPVHRSVGPPPLDIPLDTIEFASNSNSVLRGWFARGSSGRGVLLLHGVRSDRRSMLDRARFLHANGYSVLLIDLQGHGESGGEHVTFGYLEAMDAAAAIDELRQRLHGGPVAVIGTSLGGAACLLGEAPLDADAIILEAVYTDVVTAVRNLLKIKFGPPGTWLAPLLTMQLAPRLDIDPSSLRPIDTISTVRAPLLIVAGEQDRRTTLEDSRRLFRAAPEPKELWEVPGAGHIDFHEYAPAEYETRVLDFLEFYLGREST